jgi:ABC-type glycerol-3-phosphate transport system substrate-binding protein
MTGRPCRPSNSRRRGTRTRQYRFCLLILALLLGGGLAACASTPSAQPSLPPGPTPSVTVPVDLPVVVSMAARLTADELAVLDALIAAFEQANPDILVEIVRVPGNSREQRDRVAQWLRDSESGIDVYVVDDSWLAELAADGLLLPLDAYVAAAGLSADSFLPSTIQANTFGGKLLALPWTADGGLLYYRRDLLEKENDQPPTTWPELQQQALKIQKREGLPYGYVWQGAAYESLTHNTLEFIRGFGGQVLDEAGNAAFDNPQTRAALAQMNDLVASGVSPADVSTYTEERALATFENGEAIFMRGWSSAWRQLAAPDFPLAGRVGLAPLPASSLSERGLVLSRHSLYPEQAFRWMAFLTAYEQQVEWASQTGQPPALTAAYADAGLLAAEPAFEVMGEALAAATPRPQVVPYPALSEAIYSEVNHMLAGELDDAATAARIQSRLEEILGAH